jgi:ABC-type spermidine/putrescine transport system permease subunit II
VGTIATDISFGISIFSESSVQPENHPSLIRATAYIVCGELVLTEAAYSLGSGWWRTFLTIILPNIWPGIISAALLTFSVVMGEFTIAQLFSIYTFPIFLNGVGQNDPHRAASLSILSFINSRVDSSSA